MPQHLRPAVEPIAVPAVGNQRSRPRPEYRRIAYLMSRFPKITETFILYEMVAMQALGVDVEVYPLWREPGTVAHPEARSFAEDAHFVRWWAPRVWAANWSLFWERPGRYVSTLWAALRGTWGSARYFAGALAIFGKVVYFARLMRQNRIDRVHAHFASHPALAAFIIRRLVDIPYSFTAHGSDIHIDRRMLREKLREASFAVAISEYNRQVMQLACDEADHGKIRVVHCGVDTRLFKPRPMRRSSSTALSIACVGTLHEVKGQRVLIQACRRLLERGRTVSLHFVGLGPDREALAAEAVAAGLAGAVTFHGALPRPRVADVLLDVDMVAVPSVPSRDGRREGIPVALMEAMSCGVPVVASRLSGIPELVDDEQNGLLIPPGDADALADALDRLGASPSLRRRLGEAARFTILRDFDLYKNAGRLAQHFVDAEFSDPMDHGQDVLPFPGPSVSPSTADRPGEGTTSDDSA